MRYTLTDLFLLPVFAALALLSVPLCRMEAGVLSLTSFLPVVFFSGAAIGTFYHRPFATGGMFLLIAIGVIVLLPILAAIV